MFGTTQLWEYAKGTQYQKLDCKADLCLHYNMSRPNMIDFCAAKNKQGIVKIKYKRKKRNSGFNNYVTKHKQIHNVRAFLADYTIHRLNEFQKVTYLLGGIADKSINTCVNTIVVNPGLRNSLDRNTHHVQDFITQKSEDHGTNRNIREFQSEGLGGDSHHTRVCGGGRGLRGHKNPRGLPA